MSHISAFSLFYHSRSMSIKRLNCYSTNYQKYFSRFDSRHYLVCYVSRRPEEIFSKSLIDTSPISKEILLSLDVEIFQES